MEYEDKAFGGVDWNGAAAEDKRFCYNPPANYKVLVNRSTYWPTGWTWWIIDQFSRPIRREQKFMTRRRRTFHVRTETSSIFLRIIFVENRKCVTAAT